MRLSLYCGSWFKVLTIMSLPSLGEAIRASLGETNLIPDVQITQLSQSESSEFLDVLLNAGGSRKAYRKPKRLIQREIDNFNKLEYNKEKEKRIKGKTKVMEQEVKRLKHLEHKHQQYEQVKTLVMQELEKSNQTPSNQSKQDKEKDKKEEKDDED